MYAEAMLLINNDQHKLIECDTFLKKGMSAHDDSRLAICDSLQ